jgi:hypothetical protein
VLKQFGVDLMFKGSKGKKPKINISARSEKFAQFGELLQAHLNKLARETIPKESTAKLWKGKESKVVDEMPQFLKKGNAFNKNGVSGQYPPSLNLSVRLHTGDDMKRAEKEAASYVPPPASEVAMGRNDDPDLYIDALKCMPPPTWNIKVLDPEGNPLKTDVLLEKRTLAGQVMIDLNSFMLMPVSTLSLQMVLVNFRLSPEAGGSGKRINHEECAEYWKAHKPNPAAEDEEPLKGDAETGKDGGDAEEEEGGAISD